MPSMVRWLLGVGVDDGAPNSLPAAGTPARSPVPAPGAAAGILCCNNYPHQAAPPHHRRDMDALQRELREVKGLSVLIYDQTCAAEKRRRRKRGLYPDPAKRIFINDLVCEGCGDCSQTSNCVSVQPLD